jgi:hypothetical protein
MYISRNISIFIDQVKPRLVQISYIKFHGNAPAIPKYLDTEIQKEMANLLITVLQFLFTKALKTGKTTHPYSTSINLKTFQLSLM